MKRWSRAAIFAAIIAAFLIGFAIIGTFTIWLGHIWSLRAIVLASAVAIAVLFIVSAYLILRVLNISKRRGFTGFLVRCLIVFAVLQACEGGLYYLFPSVEMALRDSAASFVGVIMHLGNMAASVAGPAISLNGRGLTFVVSPDCLGGLLVWAYLALVLAQPGATNRQRLLGVFVGSAIIVAFNIIRITLSVYVEGRTGVNIHDYFYLFNMVFVLLVWAGWVRTLKPSASAPARIVS